MIQGFLVKANIINFLDVHLEPERPLTKKEKRALKKQSPE
jgi:hypothetical protein